MDIEKITSREEYEKILSRVAEISGERSGAEPGELERLAKMLENYVEEHNLYQENLEADEGSLFNYDWEKDLENLM